MARFYGIPSVITDEDTHMICDLINNNDSGQSTRSKLGAGNVGNMTMFGMNEVLHRSTTITSESKMTETWLAEATGGSVGIWDLLEETPGFTELYPEDIQTVGSDLSPGTGFGDEGKNTTSVFPKNESSAQASAVIQIARQEIGTTETSKDTNKYTDWFGMNGYPWCAMFVSWCLNRAGFPRPESGTSITHDPLTPHWVKVFQDAGRWKFKDEGDPLPGDLIFFNFNSGNDSERIRDYGNPVDHVGIVVEVLSDGRISTIEGNTSGGGSQNNGGAVLEKQRTLPTIYGYGTPPYSSGTSTTLPGPDGILGTDDDVVVQSQTGGSGGASGGSGTMTAGLQTWIADALRDNGVTVEEVDGWQSRYAPKDTGDVDTDISQFLPEVLVIHSTATPSLEGDLPTRNTILNGRSDLPGPLYNIAIGRTSGKAYLFAAGMTRNAGAGGWNGAQGNMKTIGLVFENPNGAQGLTQDITSAAYTAMVNSCAAICNYSGIAVSQICGHKEWAPTRKSDPIEVNMDTFRADVTAKLAEMAGN